LLFTFFLTVLTFLRIVLIDLLPLTLKVTNNKEGKTWWSNKLRRTHLQQFTAIPFKLKNNRGDIFMNFKRLIIVAVGTLALSITGVANQAFAGPHSHFSPDRNLVVAAAGISVTIGIPGPPPVAYSYPPELVVIPGTNAYFVPNVGVDIVFYGGYWWRSYRGYWYRAHSYNGPWYHMTRERVPHVIYSLPRGYRHTYSNHSHLNYREVEKNWHKWQRERHWEHNYHRDRRDYQKEKHQEREEYRHR
jgi:hypothetical protein